MSNLDLYNSWRKVPKDAQKVISAGRLKGFTDISPMWRIRSLTEQFGPCGIGWVAEVVRSWIDDCGDVKICNVEVALRFKYEGEWSMAVTGIGGSQLVAKETKGLYADDEAYKKAYTDALSVACRSLGMGADVYWQGGSKYDPKQTDNSPKQGEDLPKYEQPELKPVEIEYANKDAKEALFAGLGNDMNAYNALLERYGLYKNGKYQKIPMDIYNKMFSEVFETQEKLPWE